MLFAEDVSQITKVKNGLESQVKTIAASSLGTEIRSIKLKNNSKEDMSLEVTGLFQPVLSKLLDDVSHPAFNNLFLKYSLSKSGDVIVRREKRGEAGTSMCLGANLFFEGTGKAEYETDFSKVLELINSGDSFSSSMGLVTEPCLALRRKITLKPNEETILNLVICAGEDTLEISKTLEYYSVGENVKQEFNIARAKASEEARYLNLSKSDLKTFNMILPYVLYQNPMKALDIEALSKREFKQSDFWKYGISGDLPIILVTVQSINDVYVVKELLKVHEILRAKGISVDLCILDYEKNVYEQYVKEQIIQEILNLQIGYLRNISGGIFLLNASEIEDEELFKFRANIVINGSRGRAAFAISELEEEFKRRIPSFSKEITLDMSYSQSDDTIKPNVDMESLKFYNGFGGFSDDRKRVYC